MRDRFIQSIRKSAIVPQNLQEKSPILGDQALQLTDQGKSLGGECGSEGLEGFGLFLHDFFWDWIYYVNMYMIMIMNEIMVVIIRGFFGVGRLVVMGWMGVVGVGVGGGWNAWKKRDILSVTVVGLKGLNFLYRSCCKLKGKI